MYEIPIVSHFDMFRLNIRTQVLQMNNEKNQKKPGSLLRLPG